MSVSTSTQLPVIRNIEEAAELCHEFDAVITAGPEKFEVSGWSHPNHLVVSFDDVTDDRYGDAPRIEHIRKIVSRCLTISGFGRKVRCPQPLSSGCISAKVKSACFASKPFAIATPHAHAVDREMPA